MQASADDLGALVLEIFRLNNRLLTSGDRIVGGLGLTSARWQILGTVARADRPQTVAQIAREAGVARQGVQRIVNELVAEQLLELFDNRNDKRAQLVGLSSKGLELYRKADTARRAWLTDVAQGTTRSEIERVRRTLLMVRERLEPLK
jgi:DNA-binding MarR family transcriptional regulator